MLADRSHMREHIDLRFSPSVEKAEHHMNGVTHGPQPLARVGQQREQRRCRQAARAARGSGLAQHAGHRRLLQLVKEGLPQAHAPSAGGPCFLGMLAKIWTCAY